ncbi:hypothetical protein B0G77_6672 [Paraburkholderia sp. BL10I2N1]|nr:hypothetical protein B0G77_6672 [Paraburkholderia sp. BL10I2N1]
MHKLAITNLTGLVLKTIDMGLIRSRARKHHEANGSNTLRPVLDSGEPAGTSG